MDYELTDLDQMKLDYKQELSKFRVDAGQSVCLSLLVIGISLGILVNNPNILSALLTAIGTMLSQSITADLPYKYDFVRIKKLELKKEKLDFISHIANISIEKVQTVNTQKPLTLSTDEFERIRIEYIYDLIHDSPEARNTLTEFAKKLRKSENKKMPDYKTRQFLTVTDAAFEKILAKNNHK